MRQRAMIAMAIANDPDVIIADEPTTALDVTIQAQVLEVLKKAQQETGAAMIMITHDLGVVAGIADRVTVMYAGRPVEQGTRRRDLLPPADAVHDRPAGRGPAAGRPGQGGAGHAGGEPAVGGQPAARAARSRRAARWSHRACTHRRAAAGADRPGRAPRPPASTRPGSPQEKLDYADIFPVPEIPASPIERIPRDQRKTVLQLDDMKRHYPLMKGAVFRRRIGTVYAVDGIDLEVKEGETLGLVGESGCGKSTTLLEILNLKPPTDGRIAVLGRDVGTLERRERKQMRRDLQVVFQDPMASLDPRMPVFDLIAEPLGVFKYSAKATEDRVNELLRLVGLEPSFASRYPQQFSGGQRQRIGIARALALEPKVIVLDEPVSALDVSIQAGVINLLDELKAKLNLSYLFVAHDLAVIRHIADRVAVMYLGKIVEIGDVDSVYDHPTHPYTQALLSAIPIPDPVKERSRTRILLTGDLPSPANPPSGCRFRTRCFKIGTLTETQQQRCVSEMPALLPVVGRRSHVGLSLQRGARCRLAGAHGGDDIVRRL